MAAFPYSSYSERRGRSDPVAFRLGCRFLDYDNDGWKDLIVAQGHDIDNIQLDYPQLHYKEPMLLMHNDGKRLSMCRGHRARFSMKRGSGVGWQRAISGMTAAWTPW